MKKLLKSSIFVILIMNFFLIGCGFDNYDTIPDKTERVVLKRIYDLWHRTAGLKAIEILTTGKKNHGNGPCVAYDFDMSIKQREIKSQVKLLDNINLLVTISCSYRMIPGRSIDAALNFLPVDAIFKGKDPEPSRMNSIQEITVPIGEIFDRNILPYFDETSRDVIDGYKSIEIKPTELGDEIHRALVNRLRSQKIPRTTYSEKNGTNVIYPKFSKDKEGHAIYAGPYINIADVVEIMRVSIVGYSNPDFINKKIKDIEKMKARVSELQEELKQWGIKTQTRQKKAEHAKQAAINIKNAIKTNPEMMKLQRLNNLRGIINTDKDSDKKSKNTQIFLVPKNMVDSIRLQLNSGNSIQKSPKKIRGAKKLNTAKQSKTSQLEKDLTNLKGVVKKILTDNKNKG